MTKARPTGGLMTLQSAAEQLKIESQAPARWLRRYLMTRERETGREILVRVGKRGARRPTYRVSLARLRLVCPELFDDGRDQMERAVRTLVGSIGKRLDEIGEAVDEQAANTAALAEATRRR